MAGLRVECIDATGRIVRNERLNGTAMMRTTDVANGLYVLRVLDQDGRLQAQGRMVVQH